MDENMQQLIGQFAAAHAISRPQTEKTSERERLTCLHKQYLLYTSWTGQHRICFPNSERNKH
jgi:hypothetical protein